MAFSRLPLTRVILGRFLPHVSGGGFNLLPFSHRFAKPLNVSSFSTQRTADCDSQACKYHFAPLSTRSVVHVSGPETSDFLQGLVTNDVRHLLDNGSTPVSQNCIYSFMLNTSGRILFDLFIYNFSHHNDELFIEVDSQLASSFVALLKRYKIRRKITIKVNETAKVFTIYPDAPKDAQKFQIQGSSEQGDHLLAQDPRNYHFGYRLLTFGSKQVDVPLILSTENSSFKDVSFVESDTEKYRIFRYQNGIAEGSVDFPPETMFPFEANAELLNGVSFQKGCYVGQELTARTFHTGVVRKRLVPFELLVDSSTDLPDTLPLQNVIEAVDGDADEDAPKKVMGRFKVNFGRIGLASLKHGDIFTEDKTESTNLKLDKSGYRMRVWRPFWWPDKKF